MNRRSILLLPGVGLGSLAITAHTKELDPNLYCGLHYCYLNGLRYTFGILRTDYEKLPRWTPLDGTHPPVLPGDAYKLAKAHVDTIKIPANYGWELEQIALVSLGGMDADARWTWNVRFRYFIRGFSTGIWPRMNYIVTMDGKLVEPIVDKDKK